MEAGQDAKSKILVYTGSAREAKAEILVDDSMERLQGTLLKEGGL